MPWVAGLIPVRGVVVVVLSRFGVAQLLSGLARLSRGDWRAAGGMGMGVGKPVMVRARKLVARRRRVGRRLYIFRGGVVLFAY